MNKPLVSVVIPVYNKEKYIEETLQSVFNQTYKNIEVIVVNDGSTDTTAQILEKYKKRINIIEQNNQGVAKSRNNGFRNSKGEYLQFIDGDDLLLPEKIEKQVKFLEKNKSLDLVYSDFKYFKEFNRDEYIPHYLEFKTKDLLDTLTLVNYVWIQTVLIRKKCINNVGEFKGNGAYLLGVDDWEFVMRAAYLIKEFGFIPEVLVLIRRTSNSISTNIVRMKQQAIYALFEFSKILDRNDVKKLKIKKKIKQREYELGVLVYDQGHYFRGIGRVWKSMMIFDKDIIEKMFCLIMLFFCVPYIKRDKALKSLNKFYLALFKNKFKKAN